MIKHYKTILWASAMLLASSTALATAAGAAVPAWEIIVMGGVGPLSAEDTDLDISYVETDGLTQTNSDAWTSWTGQLGTGYIIPLMGAMAYSEQVQWLTAIEPQMNIYYLQGDVNGDVDRFEGYPGNFNDNEYSMEIKSTRVMADLSLTVASWRGLSTYVIAGFGPSWNSVDYTANESYCVEEVSLNETGFNLAWEVGAGMTYAFDQHFGATIEYLYANINDVALGDDAEIGEVNTDIGTDNFDLVSQTVFLGLRYAF